MVHATASASQREERVLFPLIENATGIAAA
jgi:hypothetical protein